MTTCRECNETKHAACDGTAFVEAGDELETVPCECAEREHAELADIHETCRACDHIAASSGVEIVLAAHEDIALCTRHWNWWLTAYALGPGEPPCSAHLADFARAEERAALEAAEEARRG
jgi:hypothetical protein